MNVLKKKEKRMHNLKQTVILACLALELCLATMLAACAAPAGDNRTGGNIAAAENHQPLLAAGVNEIDASAYVRVPLEANQLEVSSINIPAQGRENLVRSGTGGFWHIKAPREETRPWLKIDLETPQTLAVFAIYGRQDADQLWQGYRATLEASDDNINWETVAGLGLGDNLSKKDWIYFRIPEPRSHRYYRFSTYDWNFMALARIAVYVPSGAFAPRPAKGSPGILRVDGVEETPLSIFTQIPLTASQIEVSSVINPALGGDNLVRADGQGFWHVQMPRRGETDWVLADLGAEEPVMLLRVSPRTNYPEQLWYGYTATLEASHDKQQWTPVAELGMPRTELIGDHVNFLVGNFQPYRYYRLSIRDTDFLSMSGLEFYKLNTESPGE